MKIACENIDRLTEVSIRPHGMPRSKMAALYDLLIEDGPVSYQVAQAVLARPKDKIGIFTGAAIPVHLPNGENDGPLGSVGLARALRRLNYDVTIYTEIESLGPTQAVAELMGCDADIVELERQHGAQHEQLADQLDIAFTVEKAGVNGKGVPHSINGNSRAGTRAEIDRLINRMNDAGKITVGIGDGGNEIGFGKVFEAASDLLPFGRECVCGCGGGIVTTTATTYMYPAAISNWGAYSLAAALAIGSERPDIIVEPDEERQMLELAIQLDCRDGATGKAIFALDGVSGETSVAFVQIVKELVNVTLRPYTRDF